MVKLESNRIKLFVGAVCVFAAGSTIAQTKWDMPTGYAPTNFHTENVKQFAADVEKASGGKLIENHRPRQWLAFQTERNQARGAIRASAGR